jgi:hypothetical protein
MSNYKEVRVKSLELTDSKGEKLEIKRGDYVKVETDQTDYDDEYEGFATNIDEESFSVDNSGMINIFHIVKIDKP